MHIENCNIQKTQPPHTAKKKRESMVSKMVSFKHTLETMNENENPRVTVSIVIVRINVVLPGQEKQYYSTKLLYCQLFYQFLLSTNKFKKS